MQTIHEIIQKAKTQITRTHIVSRNLLFLNVISWMADLIDIAEKLADPTLSIVIQLRILDVVLPVSSKSGNFFLSQGSLNFRRHSHYQ